MDNVSESQPARNRWLKWAVFILAGLLFLGWLLNTPPGVLGKVDAIGYSVCHRIDARSFHIGDRQFPVCARCSGMFLGALLGLAYQAVFFPRRSGAPPWYVIAFLVIFTGAFGFDGVNSYLHLINIETGLYEPRNILRLITGTGMGITMAAGLYPAFNSTIWADWDDRPALPGLLPFAGLVGAAAVLDAVILLEIPAILYPLALLSGASILLLLVMIYTMVAVMVLRKENRYTRIQQLVVPLALGFIIAMTQIAAIDYVRYLLTGTWGGFILG